MLITVQGFLIFKKLLVKKEGKTTPFFLNQKRISTYSLGGITHN